MCCLMLACNSNIKQTKIKKEVVTISSVKTLSGDYIKDSMKTKYEIGFYNDGKQKYFLGIAGYGKVDTNYTIPSTYKKQVDSTTYYYNLKTNRVEMFVINKGDSSFQYSVFSDDKPVLDYINIYNSNKHLIKTLDLVMDKSEVFLKTEFDKNDNLIYALIQSDYYPSDLDKKIYSSEEILLKKAQREYLIKEISYIYY